MLANFTITLDEHLLPGIISGVLLIIPMIALRRGLASAAAHVNYFCRLNTKSAWMHKGTLSSIWATAAALVVSLGSYLPEHIGGAGRAALNGGDPFPARLVLGIVLPAVAAVVASCIIFGSTASAESSYGLSNAEEKRRRTMREWKSTYRQNSKYME